jgi:tetratricopeptide (TPR) repeat protein
MTLEALVNASADLLDAGRAAEGRALALEAIQLEPDCGPAWANLSWAELQLGDLAQAQAAAERAVDVDPLLPSAWHNLGETHGQAGRFEQALSCNSRALVLDRRQATCWAGRGGALVGLRRFDEAVACFDIALALDPEHVPARANRLLAQLETDPPRRRLFLILLGVAVSVADGKLDHARVPATVAGVVRGNPAYDADLVRDLDGYLQAHVPAKVNPTIVHLCEVNLLLATWLDDPGWRGMCAMRLAQVRAAVDTPGAE